MSWSRRLAGLSLVAAGVLSCKSETTTPPAPVPTELVLSSNSASFSALGATQQIGVTVEDQNGQPIAGATATFNSADPGVATVSETGLITAVANGTTNITVTHATLTAQVGVSVAQVVTELSKTGGDQQTGAVATQLPAAIEVELRDARGNPVPGGVVPNTTVQFSAANGGSVGSTLVMAGANGRASTSWTLGTGAGAQQVDAVLQGGSAAAQFMATATAGPPAALVKVSGDNQTGAGGVALPQPIVVRVDDQFANPVSNVTVNFTPAPGNGSVNPASTPTGTNGEASTLWTIGAGAGGNVLTVDAASLTSVTFGATTAAGTVAAFAGNNQIGLVGYAVNVAPAVRVVDGGNNPLPGLGVTFAVASGGGSVTGETVTTDGNGVARVGSWILGATPGANGLTATVNGASTFVGNPVSFAGTGEAATYNLVITYQSGTNPTAAQQTAFNNAAALWQTVIFRDLVDVAVNADASGCGIGIVNKTIDDIEIFVTFGTIDGAGGTLAQAGRCDTSPPTLRSSNGLPVLGTLKMDDADLAGLEANGTLQATVTHEMGHALGYDANLFAFKGRMQNPSLPSSPGVDTHFNGPEAIAAMDASGGAGYALGAKVPLENTAISGQADSHWRETVFDEELMTPFVETGGVPMPFSRVTAAAMLDLGYGVNLAGAEAFSLGAPPFAAVGAPRVKISLGHDAVFYRLTTEDAHRGRP